MVDDLYRHAELSQLQINLHFFFQKKIPLFDCYELIDSRCITAQVHRLELRKKRLKQIGFVFIDFQYSGFQGIPGGHEILVRQVCGIRALEFADNRS